jgi:hypothetical protein
LRRNIGGLYQDGGGSAAEPSLDPRTGAPAHEEALRRRDLRLGRVGRLAESREVRVVLPRLGDRGAPDREVEETRGRLLVDLGTLGL